MVMLLAGCAGGDVLNESNQDEALVAKPLNENSKCRADSECVVVSDICDCNHGGGRIAIHRSLAPEWEKGRSQLNMVCIAVISQDWSCGDVLPRCVNQQCELMPSKIIE